MGYTGIFRFVDGYHPFYSDLESFIKAVPKYSLFNDRTIQKPRTTVLLVNGTDDEIFPIDNLFDELENGQPKAARTAKGKKHMGVPDTFGIILKYIYELLGIEANVVDHALHSFVYSSLEWPGHI
ncbi:hypothetical protein DV736_g1519, partial [Chaetothyriales sp. CBS 134916]